MEPDTIALCYVHNYTVDEEWAQSIALAFANPDNQLTQIVSGANPRHESARNSIIKNFLETDCEWLFWADTDQVFEHDAPARLRQAAHDAGTKAAGGITYIYKRDTQEITTNGFSWNGKEKMFQDIHVKNNDKILKIAGTGSAFVLVHREMYEWHQTKYKHPWHTTWDRHYQTKHYMGHDLGFFYDTCINGPYELVWDTTIEALHKKHFLLGWDMYRQANDSLWA